MQSNFSLVSGIVKPGHQVASGQADNSPYEQGTIAMQQPFFQELGLDLSSYYFGTLNIDISPCRFELRQPQYTFQNVQWHPHYPAETFSFSACKIIYRDQTYKGLIYYPHPETKIGHFQTDSILEAIAKPIPEIGYGDKVMLQLNSQEIEVN